MPNHPRCLHLDAVLYIKFSTVTDRRVEYLANMSYRRVGEKKKSYSVKCCKYHVYNVLHNLG